MRFLNGKGKIMGGLALAGALTFSGVAIAQQGGTAQQGDGAGREWKQGGGKGGGRRGGGGFGGRYFERLNLTDAQQAQIEQIQTRYRESMKSMHQQLRGSERGGAREGFGEGTFNEGAVRAAAQQRANAHVELEVARARMMNELYNVLTPEQKSQLAAERQQREQRRQERRQRRQAGTSNTTL